ncbi:hypothetical protein PTQ27_03715 [Mannheimia sp. AT1]|uniref:Hemophilus-specific protein n=1 Tax=Mannheimia cairinae TaxID=3025936 RepID=A0ABT5MQ12_9PAST|nr:hypothetical protein [Mannheimia cairinae]MDD0823581.1 hypothetical protein [Mannheimia cairinae]MDD0825487.1 hypothetical protein [Mannheimia cairinae]
MDTMMSLRFDKLRFVKRLQEANQTPEIAEAFADALDEALEQSQSALATKQDLKELKAEIRNEISNLEVRLTSSMYKMAGFILAGVGVLMGLMKFIN